MHLSTGICGGTSLALSFTSNFVMINLIKRFRKIKQNNSHIGPASICSFTPMMDNFNQRVRSGRTHATTKLFIVNYVFQNMVHPYHHN